MKPTLRIMFAIAIVAWPALAGAETLSDEEINRLFTNNTVTGRYLDGQFFTEYHDADGHAYGENRSIPNTDACWITQPGKVCYYYGPQEKRSLFCFTAEKSGDTIVLTNAPPNLNAGRINAFAKIEPGNPRKLTDNGKPWYCDGLVSALPGAAHASFTGGRR
ncbi:MAG: hypothetical protein K2P80_13350 [Beijerinckiaceae bacterium]|nr:hypothetical protein [Beijerinckiaceae bacterium]